MKDAHQLKLPSWPPRVLFLRHGHQPASDNDHGRNSNDSTSASNNNVSDLEANKSLNMLVGSEPLYERLPSSEAPVPRFKRRKVRWALFSLLAFGTITIILLSTLLTRHRLEGALFKKTCLIDLPQGTYMGQILGPDGSSPRAIQAYLGVPYAQSTEGQNRFQPPRALEARPKSDDAYQALTFGDICPQGKYGSAGQSENCLNANIYRPHFGYDVASIAAEEARLGVDSKKLPVVVYVHGGGFNMGSGKERNMASFAAFADSPIITISFNYRVGALGFLPSNVMAKQGLLNLGLKDQQFFFKWMRDNLPAIGGDLDNVTVMGLSAGSHSIGHHLISYSEANKINSGPAPFQKAIIESGGATARAVYYPDYHLHEQQFQQFLMHCGLDGVPEDKLFDRLREIPYSTVVSAMHTVWDAWSGSLRWPFQPVIDGPGGVIPDLPINSLQKGNMLRIPILTGFNTNEGAGFVPQQKNNESAVRDLMGSIIMGLNKTDLGKLDDLYPSISSTEGQDLYTGPLKSKRFGTEFWRLDDAYAHYAYICPVLQTADFASKADNAQPLYVYHFAARSSSFGAADHGDEVAVVTHDMGAIGRYPGLVAAADAMTGAWTRFAVTGDPNLSLSGARAEFVWPRYVSPFESNANNAEAGQVALFGEGNDEKMGYSGKKSRGTPVQVSVLTPREKDECDYWWPRAVLSEGAGKRTTAVKKPSIKAKL